MGRWLSRDPIGEEGGLNLYRFVGNDGVDRIDRSGRQPLQSNMPEILGMGRPQMHRIDPATGEPIGPEVFLHKLTYSTYGGPYAGKCGHLEAWKINFKLEKPYTNGGVLYQYLSFSWDIYDCKGKRLSRKPESFKGKSPKWIEAQLVHPNSATTAGRVPSDTWRTGETEIRGRAGRCTKGELRIFSNAVFIEATAPYDIFEPPASTWFASREDTGAGSLRSTPDTSVWVIKANEHDIAKFLVHENIWIALEAAVSLERLECVSLETRDLAKVALRRYREKYPVQLSGPPFWDHFEAVIRKPLCSKRSSFGP